MFFMKVSLGLGHHLLLVRAAVVEVGSNINPVCALSLDIGDALMSLSLYSKLNPTALADWY